MPPRKRTPSAPKTEAAPEQEPLVSEGEADDQPSDADADDATEAEQAPGDDKSDDGKAPERSDLQTVDKPCEECLPNGWPEGAFSVGCTHGTWVRDQA
jgi:hypothetical protein